IAFIEAKPPCRCQDSGWAYRWPAKSLNGMAAISRSEADPARAAPLPFCCQLPAPKSWRCNRAVQPRITRIPRFPEGATGSDQLRAGFSGEVCFGLFHFWLRCWLVGQFSRRQSKPEDAACARYAFHTDTTTELLDD